MNKRDQLKYLKDSLREIRQNWHSKYSPPDDFMPAPKAVKDAEKAADKLYDIVAKHSGKRSKAWEKKSVEFNADYDAVSKATVFEEPSAALAKLEAFKKKYSL